MERSSSATRTVGGVMNSGAGVGLLVVQHRQVQAELCTSGTAVHLDQATVIADDLGNQSEAQSAARRLRRDERLEQMRANVVRNAWAVVPHRDQERHVEPGGGSGDRKAHAVLESCGQNDLRDRL